MRNDILSQNCPTDHSKRKQTCKRITMPRFLNTCEDKLLYMKVTKPGQLLAVRYVPISRGWWEGS
eukprot:10334849-Heterocapsa_arctica.AAC.1